MSSEFKRADKLDKGDSNSSNSRKYRMLVTKVNGVFSVLSLNSSTGTTRQYTVKWDNERWICTCPDFRRNSSDYACKHIEAVFVAAMEMQRAVEVEVNGRVRLPKESL
ncbi:SWIM zinc finger family protein [Archaeoglobus neptunius]|uniref:SWIM zinc finger family protein n=1 Tax=Archaeoglobus neptunius TaxID=2798580 RepID=UPI0019268AFD|nr:SWIM zinc finger family protein [Archaeoglobus neptunius]